MTIEEFVERIALNDRDLEHLPPLLRALAALRRGDWDMAHNIADHIGGTDGDWLHAHLHRVEGDLWNANYWYSRSGRKMTGNTIQEEWDTIAREFLSKYLPESG